MAKNKKPDKNDNWTTCTSYYLEIKTEIGSITLKEILPGDHYLPSDAPLQLVQAVLKVIAESYPDVGWQFQVDEDGWIAKVRSKPKK